MTTLNVQLPNDGWRPRPDQMPLWSYLENGGKRAVEAGHRRWGKDDVLLRWGSVAANGPNDPPRCYGRVGTYWHLLPSYTQSRKAIWEAINPRTGKRRIDEAFPDSVVRDRRETDMFYRFNCGSTWQVVGSDNFDSLVGTPPVGVTFSEYALSDPRCWAYLSPILEENGGWAAFISSPRGRNHFHKLFKYAQRMPGWYAGLHSAYDTPVYNPEQLAAKRLEYIDLWGDDDGAALFDQEYLVSFDAPLVGAYYAKLIASLEARGNVLDDGIAHDPDYPVETAWDIGYSDDTAIWWFQVVAGELRVLRYRADRGQPPEHYAKLLDDAARERGWRYYVKDPREANHHVPWDARPRTLASKGKTLIEIFWEDHGVQLKVCKNISVYDGIANARRLLRDAWFDAPDCDDGLECLRNYQRALDEARSTDDHKVFRDTPEHGWPSHGADAFRILANSTFQRVAYSSIGKRIVPIAERYKDVERATFEDLLAFNSRVRGSREDRI